MTYANGKPGRANTDIGQSWFPESWIDKDIRDARTYDANNPGQGLSQGIEAVIDSLQEIGQSFDEVRRKITGKFAITDEEADEYMEKYWK